MKRISLWARPARHLSMLALSSLAFSSLAGCAVEGTIEPGGPTGRPDSADPTGSLTEQPLTNVVGPESTILAEVVSPGGSVVAFVQQPDGAIGMLEHGLDGSISLSKVDELVNATPYEVFRALAPDREVPVELELDYQVALASGYQSQVPKDFSLASAPAFHDADKYYSSCTNISGWKNATNGAPVGPNCKSGGTCLTNYHPNFMGCLPGGGCYPTGWNQRMRWSTCNRGTGKYRAFLVTYPVDATYKTLVDVDTAAAGAYYYYWRYVPGNDDRWSMGKWDLSGDPSGHFSLWGEL